MKCVSVQARRRAALLAAVLAACGGCENTRPLGPAKMAFIAAPSNTTAGAVITPAVQVVIQDVHGNTVTSARTTVNLLLAGNATGGMLSGTKSVTAVNGVATFSDLSIDKQGDGYAITASSVDLPSVTSAAFTITGPTKLAFTVQPSATTAGLAITPTITVAIQDALGHTVPNATNAVTISFGSNPTGATLRGATTVNAASGVAIFSDLSIDKPSAGYTLTVTSADLASATSPPFTINAAPPPPVALHVTTTTTGTSLPSSYFLSVDPDSYGSLYAAPIAPNGAVTISVPAGDHFVQLSSVPDNCALSGEAFRNVTAASGTTEVPFVLTCGGIGTLRVTTTTGGTDTAPDGYTVCVDQTANSCYWHAQAGANDAVTISRILSGPHTVTLTNVGGNCTVTGGTAHAVTILADATVSAPFSVTCSPTERIAFSSNGTIGVVHSDGTSTHTITGGLAPAWSPDGARLAYECGQSICTINADGTGLTQVISSGGSNRHPTWSPDGLKIAFASTASGTNDLYVVAASGGSAVRLTQGVGFLGNPAWSPDGTQIAFDCQVDAGNSDICTVHADGTGLARLTSDPASDYGAAWKADGSTLAFTTWRFGSPEIVLMSSTGGSVSRIGAGLEGYEPAWSPDGTQLAFVQVFVDPYNGPYETIFTAHVDGSNTRTVTGGAQPAWKPHR